MTENNGSSKRDDAKVDGVVDELRNVLSGLGRTPLPPEPKAAPAPLADPIPETDRGGSSFANGKGAASEPLASDADFWNGNVLGWPANADADLPDVPAAKNSIEPAPSDNGFLREDATESGLGGFGDPMMPEPIMPAPSDEDLEKLSGGDEPTVFLPPMPAAGIDEPTAEEIIPVAPPAPSASAVPASKPVVPSADPWLRPGLGLDAPEPEPIAPPPARVEPSRPERALFAAPAASTEFEVSEAVKAPDATPIPAAASVRPAADFEFELPIPGTKEVKDKPAVDTGPQLDLEGTQLKPEDLVQIACIYPEGQEKAGQSFVNRLREAAEKLRAPMSIQAVFVSGWAPDKIDPASWAKSASLSGADAMFVLSFRASAALFKDLAAATKGGPKSRLLMLEQVNFPTLYADVLVELRRSR